ncbi:MAG: hypothetical protein ACJ8C4_07340 [Gemmataceae bacterium]
MNSWVIYQACVPGDPTCSNPAVCSQFEWERMVATRPGRHRLLHSGIASEGEAERLARQQVPQSAPAPAIAFQPRSWFDSHHRQTN